MAIDERLHELLTLGGQLNSIQDVDMLLEKILYEARRFVSADAGTIYILDNGELVFSHAQNDTLSGRLAEGKKLIYQAFSLPVNDNSIAGHVALTREALNIPNVYEMDEKLPYHFDKDYDFISKYTTRSMLTVPLTTDRGEVVGVLQVINKMQDEKPEPFNDEDRIYVEHFAASASMVLQRAVMTRTMILRMIQMAELRDPKETGAHVNRVGSYSVELYEKWAQNHSVPTETIEQQKDVLRMAAMLHDVGKVAISDTILKKPARFTEEEYEIMKQHAWLGAKLFTTHHSEFDDMAAEVALSHHENWDGTGYPGRIDKATGLPLDPDSKGRSEPIKGEEISIWGRLVALADVFDALSSRRVYKPAWTEEDVLKEIRSLSGSKFDPELVDILFDSLDIIRSIQLRYPDVE